MSFPARDPKDEDEKKGRRASILEGHKTPREQWLWAFGEVRRMISEMRMMCASGRRFLALARLAKEQINAKKNGSLNLALTLTASDEGEDDAKTMSLMSTAKKVIRRTDMGKRTDAQCDIILKAFPIIEDISTSEQATSR